MPTPQRAKRQPRSRKSVAHPSSTGLAELVEVVDTKDRPIGIMPLGDVHRLGLLHRAVLVLVYNHEGKLYLQKRSPAKDRYPGRWDLSATGHVQAGESREDAAIRELREELGLAVGELVFRADVLAGPDTGYEFITLFSAGQLAAEPVPCPAEISAGYWVDRQELACLVEDFRDLLTPGLVHFWEKGLLFQPLNGR